MDLELSRIDYTIVGTTQANCMKLLPSNFAKESQKIAIADTDGILQIFSMKKDDLQLHFKSLPGPQISSIQLGGTTGASSDKLFVASDNEVKGYTKKGKLFLTFDSGMTENITSMFVMGNELFLCGKHIYNHYRDVKEVGSYLCGDRIVDVTAFYTDKTHRLISLIACEGRMIRALEHARVTLSMEVESAPTVLHIFLDENGKTILFGTVDGRVGILDVERLHGFHRWLISNKNYSSPISCIEHYDFSRYGAKNLILGRQDGNVEVYVVNTLDPMDSSILIFTHNCNESITALQCGVIGTQSYDEILIATYTGRIFGLTTEPIDKNLSGDKNNHGNQIILQEACQRVNKLKSELEDLQVKVSKEREKYQTSTQSFLEELSAIPLLSVKDSFILSNSSSSYTLTIEVPTAIDNVLIQSNIPVDLLDVEKNSAVVSYSDSNISEGNYLLATYRCQINTNRLEIKIRTIEGQYGLLQAYITPVVQPKCSRLKQYEIKPLSLHYRIHKFPEENRPFNKLTLKGTFSLAEIHSWVFQCLPEVPEKPIDSKFSFQSTFLNTVLQCSYQKGEATFVSDNISTISVMKEFLTSAATKKKAKIDFSLFVNDESINHIIDLLEPKLLQQKNVVKQMRLLNALNELEISQDNLQHLSEKYKNLINNEKTIKSEFQCQPDHLDRFYGIISDLYVDYNKFKGNNVKSKLPKLHDILENYSRTDLVNFFRPELIQQ